MSSIRPASTTTSLCVFSPDDLFWKVCMVIPAMSRLPLPIEYHTTTPSLCDVSLFLRMLAVDVFMCVQMSVDVLLRVRCVCAWKRPAWEGSCMWTFVHLLPPHCPFPPSLYRVQVSLSLSSLWLTDRQTVTHTYTYKQADYTKSIHFLLLESKLICAPLHFFLFLLSSLIIAMPISLSIPSS